MKAKNISKLGKVLSAVLLIVFFVLKSCGLLECDVNDIIKVSLTFSAIIAGTIDINIILDKFTEKR